MFDAKVEGEQQLLKYYLLKFFKLKRNAKQIILIQFLD